MPQVVKTPDGLRPYIFHGCDLSWKEGDKQAAGRCPFCSKEDKFSVEVATSVARCWVCGTGNQKGGMNALTFIRTLHEQSLAETTEADWRELAEHRKLMAWQTCRAWGCAKSRITGDWLVPGFDPWGKLANLYQWVERVENGKPRMVLMPTPTFKHQLMGTGLPKKGCQRALLCEGPWDGMAAWEVMQADPVGGQDWRDVFVCAAPTCTSFPEAWAESFDGMTAWIMFDNDHPRQAGGQSAGYSGSVRTARLLRGADAALPLRWGDQGWSPDLPSGRDVRDHLTDAGRDLPRRAAALYELIAACEPVDAAPAPARRFSGGDTEHCEKWVDVVRQWQKAYKWTEGLDNALAAMLASIVSTPLLGDQLWIKVVGPPSSGKSSLCEAVSMSKRYVLAKSTIRGFHSGWGDGEEDHGLISQLNGKTLVTKDGDTLLNSPNLGQVLSEARDLYDTTSRSSYRKKGVSRDYQGVRMTWILCGTSSLLNMDLAELGERFLVVVIMDDIDDDLEDEVLTRVAYRAEANLAFEADGSMDSCHDPDLLAAMKLTGGYVEWLRGHAQQLVSSVAMSEAAVEHCKALGRFVAFMRARPSRKQEEKAEREFAARLVGQHVRLAKCLAAVLNRTAVDTEVLRRVTQVSMDTARGSTLELCRILRTSGEDGMTAEGLAVRHNNSRERELTLLRFLRRIGAVDHFSFEREGMTAQNRYRLSKRLARLWAQVMEDE